MVQLIKGMKEINSIKEIPKDDTYREHIANSHHKTIIHLISWNFIESTDQEVNTYQHKRLIILMRE